MLIIFLISYRIIFTSKFLLNMFFIRTLQFFCYNHSVIYSMNMKIKILCGKDASEAVGVAVIIDIFRAASTEAYILNNNARYILPVGTIEEALLLKEENPSYVLIGENDGLKPDGFQYGNSPFEVLNVDFTGKVIIHRSTAGTKGVIAAKDCDEIIFGSFVTAKSIFNYIKAKNPEIVSIVAMDGKDTEDDMFAQYLASSLNNKSTNFEQILYKLKEHLASQRFLDETNTAFPKEDFDLCLDIDRFDFICKIQKEGGNLISRRLDI